MAVKRGVCRFGLWFVHIEWEGGTVFRVWFSRTGEESPVPRSLRFFLNGRATGMADLSSIATRGESAYARIYRDVREIPYGTTCTYGQVAERAGTVPRVVGNAMARNPTPLIIPCHRVVGATGLGGFTPSVEIKRALLELERRNRR